MNLSKSSVGVLPKVASAAQILIQRQKINPKASAVQIKQKEFSNKEFNLYKEMSLTLPLSVLALSPFREYILSVP